MDVFDPKLEGFHLTFSEASPETMAKLNRFGRRCRDAARVFEESKSISYAYLRPVHRCVLVRLLRGEELWVDIRALGAINNPDEYDEKKDKLLTNRQVTATLSKLQQYIVGEYRLEKRKHKGELIEARLVKI